MSSKTTKDTPSLDSVDQIRNILFGEQVAKIEKRFTDLEKSLNTSLSKLSDNLAKSIKDVEAKIKQSNSQLSSESSNLAEQQAKELKALESTINNKIIETESDLLNQIQSGLQQLDNKASHRNELAKLLKDMADKLTD
jgi:dGTP triphosphohydrolase